MGAGKIGRLEWVRLRTIGWDQRGGFQPLIISGGLRFWLAELGVPTFEGCARVC